MVYHNPAAYPENHTCHSAGGYNPTPRASKLYNHAGLYQHSFCALYTFFVRPDLRAFAYQPGGFAINFRRSAAYAILLLQLSIAPKARWQCSSSCSTPRCSGSHRTDRRSWCCCSGSRQQGRKRKPPAMYRITLSMIITNCDQNVKFFTEGRCPSGRLTPPIHPDDFHLEKARWQCSSTCTTPRSTGTQRTDRRTRC